MTTVSRTFHVDAAPERVLDYLSDFAHTEEWDPGTRSCTREDEGPIAVGARWHNVSHLAGVDTELTYTLEKRTDDTLVFVGRNKGATSTDTITVVPSGQDGSELTYSADLQMHGAAKIMTPALKLLFEKIANEVERNLVDVLGRLT